MNKQLPNQYFDNYDIFTSDTIPIGDSIPIGESIPISELQEQINISLCEFFKIKYNNFIHILIKLILISIYI
jgi:hypothetical protein